MINAPDLAEPLASRWSPTIFDPTHELDDTQITALLHAVQWAPSCGNAQPAHVLVARRGDEAHRLLVPHLSRGNSWWVPRASAVFVIVTQVAPDEQGEGGYKPAWAEYDAGQAAAHLTLQARAMDLHAHQFAGFDREGATASFAVPAYCRVMAGIAVGVRGDATDMTDEQREREARERKRRPLEQTAYGAAWNRPWRGGDAGTLEP